MAETLEFEGKLIDSLWGFTKPPQRNRKTRISSMTETIELSKEIVSIATEIERTTAAKSQNPHFANLLSGCFT
jgi:hypothetical protein